MYTIVWRYRVRADKAGEFERVYGARGDWARLFAQGEGYVGTELYREAGEGGRFLTVDEWRSQADYDRFRTAHAVDYGAIDRRCGEFTDSEECLGAHER